MRCSQCGMPLSPKRTQCPRCGTAIPGKSDKAPSPAKQGDKQQAHPVLTQQEWEAAQYAWSNSGSGADWDPTQNRPMQEPDPAGFATPSFGNEQAFPPQNADNEQRLPWAIREQSFNQQAGRLNTPPLYSLQKGSNLLAPRTGFTIAGTCIAAGTLILLLVFILAKTLPQATNANQQAEQSSRTTMAPTPTAEPTIEPSPTPSPTSDQQYFSGAQLGSDINDNTAQIVTQTTNFKLHQKIFVTFQVHTGGQIGAACLLWHWGDNGQAQFQFQLQGSTGTAYSYMPAEASGAGKVELYYASTTACSDKILTQAIDFSVSA